MNAKSLKEMGKLLKDNPVTTLLGLALLTGGSGASIGAFATKSSVDEKHATAMKEIESVKDEISKWQDKTDQKLDKLDNKMDRVIFHIRGIR